MPRQADYRFDRAQAVEAWRGRETKETAAIALRDSALQKVLAAWPAVPVVADGAAFPVFAPGEPVPWEALWAGVQVDMPALAELTGLQAGLAMVSFRRTQGLRLIYPDGTLHGMAKMVLQALIKEALKG